MIVWIITGILAMLFIIMAVFLLNGKGAFLIAGYNTMGEKDRAAYDEKALCKSVGWLLIIISALMLLFPLASQFETTWLFWTVFALIMAVPIGFAIYANTGNRFRINIDPNAPTADKERKQMTRGKKLTIIFVIGITVLMCILSGILIYFGERDPVVSISGNNISISALYGLDVALADVSEISLVDRSMLDIGIGTRTNGYASTGRALKGNFNSTANGHTLLFVYSSSSPTIQIIRASGPDIFISFRNSETTIATYHELSAALS